MHHQPYLDDTGNGTAEDDDEDDDDDVDDAYEAMRYQRGGAPI
jgi:hypothetical protein